MHITVFHCKPSIGIPKPNLKDIQIGHRDGENEGFWHLCSLMLNKKMAFYLGSEGDFVPSKIGILKIQHNENFQADLPQILAF